MVELTKLSPFLIMIILTYFLVEFYTFVLGYTYITLIIKHILNFHKPPTYFLISSSHDRFLPPPLITHTLICEIIALQA